MLGGDNLKSLKQLWFLPAADSGPPQEGSELPQLPDSHAAIEWSCPRESKDEVWEAH